MNDPSNHLKPGVIPLRPLAIGELFAGAVASVRSHAKLILGVSAVVFILGVSAVGAVLALLAAFGVNLRDAMDAVRQADPNMPPEQLLEHLTTIVGISAVSGGVTLITQMFLSGILTVVVSKAVLGRTVDFREAWAELRPQLPRLIVLTILSALIVFIGTLLCIVPGVWLGVLVSFAPTALILERTTIRHSLQRSAALVTGSWWRVFGVLLLTGLITVVASVVLEGILGVFGTGADATGRLVIDTISGIITSTVVTPFAAAVTILLYIDQRIRRERLDVELATAAQR